MMPKSSAWTCSGR